MPLWKLRIFRGKSLRTQWAKASEVGARGHAGPAPRRRFTSPGQYAQKANTSNREIVPTPPAAATDNKALQAGPKRRDKCSDRRGGCRPNRDIPAQQRENARRDQEHADDFNGLANYPAQKQHWPSSSDRPTGPPISPQKQSEAANQKDLICSMQSFYRISCRFVNWGNYVFFVAAGRTRPPSRISHAAGPEHYRAGRQVVISRVARRPARPYQHRKSWISHRLAQHEQKADLPRPRRSCRLTSRSARPDSAPRACPAKRIRTGRYRSPPAA